MGAKHGRKRNQHRKDSEPLPAIMNLSRIEEFAAKLLEEAGILQEPETARSEAMELIDQAAQIEDPAERARLARQAIRLWPDCMDAYEILAKQCETPDEALSYYEQAAAAGERRIKSMGLSLEEDGVLTENLVGFAYLSIRRRYADCLLAAGRTAEAIKHYVHCVRLDEDDLAHARLPLALLMTLNGKFDLLDRWLKRFDQDHTATWLFSQALLRFARDGDSWQARKLLRRAKGRNLRIGELLAYPDDALPEGWQFGSDVDKYVEAAFYAEEFGHTWDVVPGALDWLAKQ